MDVTSFFCLDLALTFIQRLSLRKDLEVICFSIKLFFTSIQEWEISEKNIANEKDHATDELSWKLQQKVTADFPSQMAFTKDGFHQRERFLKELQVRYP